MDSSNPIAQHDDGGADKNTQEDSVLWKYVTKIAKTSEGGGNWKWVSNFCHQEKQGTYTRVRAHLLKITSKGIQVCKKVKSDDILEMKRLEEETLTRIQNAKAKKVPLPCGSAIPSQINDSSSGQDFVTIRKRKADLSAIGKAFDIQARSQLDIEIARMFYTGGLPFNLARNPYYLSSYTFAANHDLSGYVPPGYNKLRTTLLQQEKANVERLLQAIKGTWSERGVTIVSDGWSDPQRRPLINFMATSGNGPMFLKSVNCSGEVKDKHFIANLMKEVIDEIGHQNVVQVITDNASNCKGAGEIIEGIYPNIYWTPCVVHTLNLALKNICNARNTESNLETYYKCHWITEIHVDALFVKNFIMNHSMRLAIFNRFSSLKLLSVADTRFASIVVMLKRFKLIRRSLEAMVMSDEWISYREDDQGKARFVREKVVDECWWDKVDYIIAFTSPIYDMLRNRDTDKPQLHLVYEQWDSMIKKVKFSIYKYERKTLHEASTFYEVVHSILMVRWGKSNIPLHCLAHSLNPRYYSDDWLNEDTSRVSPHRDVEISTQRMKCFSRIFPDYDVYGRVLEEYAQFSLMGGPFDDIESKFRRSTISDAKAWWANFGAAVPLLQSLAFKVLAQPTSSSCCERNWSTYSFIHSLKRNKLNPKRAEDLVFIHNNLRLLSRNSSQYKEEKTKMWDVGGDHFGSMDDMGILEFADLSLDEPDLEGMFLPENIIDSNGDEIVEL